MTRPSSALRADAFPMLACVCLLAVAAFAPEAPWLRAARGKTRFDGELRGMQTRGYYEAIIDAGRGAADPDAPPAGWVPFGAAGIVESTPSYLRWKMRPDLDVVWNGEPFHTDSRGFRTPEVEIPKPSGVYRIVFFGSSNTMGHGVADDEAYPRLMEAWLNRAAPPGVRVEVVNLAVSGDSPSRRLLRMTEEAAKYQPDWLLCDASVLDVALEEMHLEAVVRSDPRPEIPPVLDYVRRALDRRGASPTDPPGVLRGKLQREAETILSESIAGWGRAARQLGTPLTVVIIPRADARIASPAIAGIIRATIRREGLDSLDLADAFDELTPGEFRVSPWDKHPSVRGHRALLEAFRAAVRGRGGPPGLALTE